MAKMTHIQLADRSTREDLRSFLQRLAKMGEAEVRLQSRGSALAVYGCTQKSGGLLDDTPVVLVMRALALGEQPEMPLDTVVEVRALTDRLARMSGHDVILSLPDWTVTAVWAGMLPPHGGWEARGAMDAKSLAAVAEEGMARVASQVPTDAGDPVVQRVRRSVWGSEIAPGIPASVAFAAEGLGFLKGVDRLALAESNGWKRLSGPNGHVLLRVGAGFVS